MRNQILFSLLLLAGSLCAQSKKYVKSDTIYPERTEWIILRADSTFEYFYRVPFTVQTIEGKYSITDNELILNSDEEKMLVEEEFNAEFSRGVKLFDVSFLSGEKLNYFIGLIDRKGDDEILADQYGKTKVKAKIIKGFYIWSLLKYPVYIPKCKKSNFFQVKLNPNRVFDNEKWTIEGDRIKSIGFDGEENDYYLELIDSSPGLDHSK